MGNMGMVYNQKRILKLSSEVFYIGIIHTVQKMPVLKPQKKFFS